MSAWIATDKHIASVAMFISKDFAQRIADVLKRENINSVNYRYGEKTRRTKCNLKKGVELNAVDAYSLMQSLDYQSCEHPEWESTEAHSLLQAAMKGIEAYAIVRGKDGMLLGAWSL